MARQLTDRGEERRRQLMAFATRRFAEKGYHPTSVAEIVAGIGVGKGVFYWYFSSKEELLRAILREAQLDLRRSQREAITPSADLIDRIAQGIRASVEWSATNADLVELVAFATTDERFAPMIRKGAQVATTDVRRLIEEAVHADGVAVLDVEMTASAMVGITTTLTREFLTPGSRTTAEVADTAIALCLGALSGRPGAAGSPESDERLAEIP